MDIEYNVCTELLNRNGNELPQWWYDFLSITEPVAKEVKQVKKVKPIKQVAAYNTFKLGSRTITIAAVVVDPAFVSVGYSVCREGDKFDEKLAKKISKGRALSEKARLGIFMMDAELTSEFYMIKSLSLMWSKKVENNPELYIKGIK